MGPPFSWDQVNAQESALVPGALHNLDNATFCYYFRYLFNKVISQFKWTLPKDWDKDYFLSVLYCAGYITILDTPEFGVIPQWGALSGYNLYYKPRNALVTNPFFPQTYERTVGVDCEVLHLMPDYRGVKDLITFYASKLATIAAAIDINLINTRLAYVFPAKDKASAQSWKKMFDAIASGDPAVFVDKSLFDEEGKGWEPFLNNLRNNYIVTNQLDDMATVENQFCTMIGIPNANTDKRERLNTYEVNVNNVDTAILGSKWLESLKEGCDKVKKMFDVDITVEWRFDPNESADPVSDDLRMEQESIQ